MQLFNTCLNALHLDQILADERAKAILAASLDLTPAQRQERASDMERRATHADSGMSQEQRDLRMKLAAALRFASATDIGAIKAALPQESTADALSEESAVDLSQESAADALSEESAADAQ